jgi:hypothetical protein
MQNASDRKEIKRAEKAALRAERDRGEVLQQIASTAKGREWLWNQLEHAHIFSTPFSLDVNQTNFNLGEQNAGLRLLADIMQWCSEEFIQMMREANARRTESNAKSDTTERPADAERSGIEESGRQPEGAYAFPEPGSEERRTES